jgi:hypothetical protein
VSRPGGCIAAARTNAAEPSVGQVQVTMREDFTAMPLKFGEADRAGSAQCKESLLQRQALRDGRFKIVASGTQWMTGR